MSGKTLSTGTLSLRFMQNAHRAKQLKEVQLDRAEVQDEGRWEVKKEIREAWGLTASPNTSESTHESSYLPFLFPMGSDTEDATTVSSSYGVNRPKGRRVFDKKGREEPEFKPTASTDNTPSVETKGHKAHPNPVSISLSGSSSQLRGFDQLKKPKDSKSAKQAIFENSGVGVDLRPPTSAQPLSATKSAPATFLKPSGVDEPMETGRSAPNVKPETGVIEGARMKKSKRDRDVAADPTNEENKKRKKKKKAAE